MKWSFVRFAGDSEERWLIFNLHVYFTFLNWPIEAWGLLWGNSGGERMWGVRERKRKRGKERGVGEREREWVKSSNLLWALFMHTIIDHFRAIRLRSCRTWSGTGRHYLIHLRESERQRRMKWVLIWTVWDLRWLHLHQSKESSGKSTPCFQLAYTFCSGGEILGTFFQSHLPSLVHRNKLQEIHESGWICSAWNFIPQSLNADNRGVLLGCYLRARGASEFVVGLVWVSPYLLSHRIWLHQFGSSALQYRWQRYLKQGIKWRTRSEMPRDLALSLMCNMEAASLRNISLDVWLWKIINIFTGLERMF